MLFSDSARKTFEIAMRVVALLTLCVAVLLSGRSVDSESVVSAAHFQSDSAFALAEYLADPVRKTIQVEIDSVPSQQFRSLLQSAGQAGLRVFWNAPSGKSLPVAVALSSYQLPDPKGSSILRVAVADSSHLVLADSVGWLDSLTVSSAGGEWSLSGSGGEVSVSSASSGASVSSVERSVPSRIRVYGSAGWDARYVTMALEEAGWTVDASFSISPTVTVTGGAPTAPDTSRYAAIVALDSSAWSAAPSIIRYVRQGGGLLLFADAARGQAFQAVRAALPGSILAGVPGALKSLNPHEGLALRPLERISNDAVVLERSSRSGNPPVVVARTESAGRIAQIAWLETWEWRMAGGDSSVSAHRNWLNNLVKRVAYMPPDSSSVYPSFYPGNSAPLADLVARIGFAQMDSVQDYQTAETTRDSAPWWLYIVAAITLLAEWWSRRLRGVP